MANAKCCDRCGAFYKDVEAGSFRLLDMNNLDMKRLSRGREVDLCPECQKILDGFMKIDQENVVAL